MFYKTGLLSRGLTIERGLIFQYLRYTKWIANSLDDKQGTFWKISTPQYFFYFLQFLGDIEVDKPKGIDVVKQGVQKLKFNQQLKKAESGSSNMKMPKAELTISVNGVTIMEPKTQKQLHQYPLHRISYCADDKAEKRFFSFIAKDPDSSKHTCFVFLSDKLVRKLNLVFLMFLQKLPARHSVLKVPISAHFSDWHRNRTL